MNHKKQPIFIILTDMRESIAQDKIMQISRDKEFLAVILR
jgi:hypothetical protein